MEPDLAHCTELGEQGINLLFDHEELEETWSEPGNCSNRGFLKQLGEAKRPGWPATMPLVKGCRLLLVSTAAQTFPGWESTWHDLFLLGCVSSVSQIPESATRRACICLDRIGPLRSFHLTKGPRAESIFEEFFFIKIFFLSSHPPTFLFKRKWDVYLLFPYFFSGKRRVVDFLPLPSLPSFFPKVLIWEKENEVLFLFSFLSHLKHCPCEFFKFPCSLYTRERGREREGKTETARDQVKRWAAASQPSGAGKWPHNPFYLHFNVLAMEADPASCTETTGLLLNQKVWLMDSPEGKLMPLCRREYDCLAELRLAELETELYRGWEGPCIKSEFVFWHKQLGWVN